MRFRTFVCLAVVAVFSGCTSRYIDPLSLPLVDRVDALPRFEGKEVRLAGEVSNTKIPQILGVDVTSDNPDLRGRRAEAYGILKRYVVTATETDEMDSRMVAHRGPGVFWVLYDPKARAPAQVGEPRIFCPMTVPTPGKNEPANKSVETMRGT